MKYLFISVVLAMILGVGSLFMYDTATLLSQTWLDKTIISLLIAGYSIDALLLLQCRLCQRICHKALGCHLRHC